MKDVEDQSKSFVHQIKNNISWEDIKWIRNQTSLKIILKGVISPDDIPIADACGVDAIWISNHGGRQLDTSPATIFALPPIRKKINCTSFFI
jgi:isopentenyl diphosphate isomerase/L-lactate dehydrogenase-like FMN-dependent dehydrogenase